uniref:Uncharacterized protein n=1 Tax=Anguilla anguilla TaxID=7936 RepID=A0A0E9V0E6_ANGAN
MFALTLLEPRLANKYYKISICTI